METATKTPPIDVLELESREAQLPARAEPQQQAQGGTDPWGMLNNAIQKGYEAATIDRLMSLAERMEQMNERERLRQAELAYARDFAGFTGENIIVPKSKTVNRGAAGSFEQAEFDKVMGMIKPALSRHGFGIWHKQEFAPRRDDDGKAILTEDGKRIPWVYVTCFLKHRDGYQEKLSLDGPPGELSANTLVQDQQATASYLKRVSALAITGTPTAEEDNEEKLARKQQGNVNQSEFEAIAKDLKNAVIEGGKEGLLAAWKKLTPQQTRLMSNEFGKLKREAEAAERPVSHNPTKEQRK